jgi:hypothetical protein
MATVSAPRKLSGASDWLYQVEYDMCEDLGEGL